MKILATRTLAFFFLAGTVAAPFAHSQTFQVLYSFAGGSDGSSPMGWLTFDVSGNLFGATNEGGAAPKCPYPYTSFGCGTVFRIEPVNQETVLHRFDGRAGGGFPSTGLVPGQDGSFYGSAGGGTGDSAGGVIYKFNPQNGKTTVVHAFSGGSDGAGPNGVSLDSRGNLYGVATGGGDRKASSCQLNGCGVVFKILNNGQEKVLHTFTGPPDGWAPKGSLVRDSQGNLYGTTNAGGAMACNCGTIYKIDKQGHETILHSFSDSPDASLPTEGLLPDPQGNLYGVTWSGGAFGKGTIYKLDTAGNLTILYSFSGTDGANPSSWLVGDSAGNLYGFTYAGGDLSCGFQGEGCGTVFRIDSNEKLTTLHAFTGQGLDGLEPSSGHLLLDAAGHLYGVAPGGPYGIVFEITP